MPLWLTEVEYEILCAACERLIPSDKTAGATEACVADYIDGLLGAFAFDPPRIWARGPTSGRSGGENCFGRFHPLTEIDELAWRIRIEGSLGLPEREFNGPVVGLQQRYRSGLAALGENFNELSAEEQDAVLDTLREFTEMLYEHCCEGMYGPPEYGGNRECVGWRSIRFPGDVQPRGYSDSEVSGP